MSNKLRIAFMGTPAFAVESLNILVQNGYDIVAVVTAPDKPAGRGQKINMSAVKEYAIEHDILVLQPTKLKDEEFIQSLKDLNANLFVVVAFRMLPEVVWNMPEFGTFNLHASLLPQYRGAAPINWALINGETKTGVTTFFLQHEIDTGDILMSQSIDILPEDNLATLHDKLMNLGAELTLKTVKSIENNDTHPRAQSQEHTKPAPKIFKEDCLLDFNQNVLQVHNQVRGMSPFPAAFTHLEDKILKIFKTEVQKIHGDVPNGTFDTDEKTYLRIRCHNGWLNILELQLEGKKRMEVVDFLKGYRFKNS
jgi:methionyl-tRNA formyltransferase